MYKYIQAIQDGSYYYEPTMGDYPSCNSIWKSWINFKQMYYCPVDDLIRGNLHLAPIIYLPCFY